MVKLRYVKPAAATAPEATDSILGRTDWVPNGRLINKRQFAQQVQRLADAGYTDTAIARHIGVNVNLVREVRGRLASDAPEPPEAA